MAFVDEVHNLVRKLKTARGPTELVSERDVVRAYCVLNFIRYENIADVFLGCAAVNLLNAYVKNGDAKIGYTFKSHLGEILNAIDRLQSFLIKVGYDNTRQMHLLQIDISGFQFSFKSVEMTELVDELARAIPWDGFRKQQYSCSIFDFALMCPEVSNLTLSGDDLRAKVLGDVIDFEHGAFEFRDGRLVKIANLNHSKKPLTEVVNFLREKLREAEGELVLLEGNFTKVHDKHVTFTAIRPHISGVNSVIVCDHINLTRWVLRRYVDERALRKGQTYFILGYCRPYPKGVWNRMGVHIAEDLDHLPILPADEFHKITNSTFARLHRFSIEEFMARKQSELVYR